MSGEASDLALLDVRGAPVTVGDLQDAVGVLQDLLAGRAGWGDAQTIGADVLAAVAAADPALGGWLALAKIALAIAPVLIASGIVRPDPDPEVDAQTSTGRGGRNYGS